MPTDLHEDLSRESTVEGLSERSFGIVFFCFFAIVGLWPVLGGGRVRSWALVPALVFLLLALFAPAVLTSLNRVWFKFGLLLHRIVSPVVLGLIFYGVFTPAAMLMRLLGRRPLALARDPGAGSYWIARTPPGPSGESLRNQF